MRFIDFIRDRARYYNCPHCGRSLRDCELRMLRQVEDRYTIQVTCGACRVQFVLILAVQGEGIDHGAGDDVAVQREREADRPGRGPAAGPSEPIGADELLDVYLALRAFSGPLTDLFKQPSGERS